MAGDILRFVTDTVDRIRDTHTLRWGNEPSGAPCLVVSKPVCGAWTTVGRWVNGQYQTSDIPEQALQDSPVTMDFPSWSLLDRLSDVTGDRSYRELADGMCGIVVEHGFDPASGLIYVGAMSTFDVAQGKPVGTGGYDETVCFKPVSNVPWDRLWAAAPDKMARMCRATYYGLITDPDIMSYNRYVPYGFDDSRRELVQDFKPMGHVAFALTGAMFIRYWGALHAYTGEAEPLEWATKMARKWQAAQHPKTGLIPHFFGAESADDPEQSPRPFANSSDDITAIAFVEAAAELDRSDHPDAKKLAAEVRGMGLRLMHGLARESFDPARELFMPWLRLEGGEWLDTTFYHFRSEARKAEALAKSPNVANVAVYEGNRYFDSAPMHRFAGNRVPVSIASVAADTGSDELLAIAIDHAGRIDRASHRYDGPFNEQGQWLFPAMANYAEMMLHLHRATDDAAWLDKAYDFATRAVGQLAKDPDDQPEWWRYPHRCRFLESLTHVAAAVA